MCVEKVSIILVEAFLYLCYTIFNSMCYSAQAPVDPPFFNRGFFLPIFPLLLNKPDHPDFFSEEKSCLLKTGKSISTPLLRSCTPLLFPCSVLPSSDLFLFQLSNSVAIPFLYKCNAIDVSNSAYY